MFWPLLPPPHNILSTSIVLLHLLILRNDGKRKRERIEEEHLEGGDRDPRGRNKTLAAVGCLGPQSMIARVQFRGNSFCFVSF